jgi:spore germination protein YaaH
MKANIDIPEIGERALLHGHNRGKNVTLINTVNNNSSRYNVHNFSCAIHAREIQALIGRPSTEQYKQVVSRNFLPNCPINNADIDAAEDIFGQDVESIKGKTVRPPPYMWLQD